jgi:hypothetical protein
LGLDNPHPWGNHKKKKKKKKKKAYCSPLQMAGSTKKKMMKEIGEKQAKERE